MHAASARRIVTVSLVALVAARALAAQASPAASPQRSPAAAQREPEEHTIRAARVPAAVRDAFQRAWPNATVTGWSTEVEDGRTVYEAESVEGTTHRDLLIAADGTILETETRLTLAQLPAAVRTAATANGARIERAEVVVAGRDTTYEFKIRGRRQELKLRPDGQPVPATARP